MRSRTKGFTLIELLIVVMVVGILLSIAVFNGRGLLQGENTRGTAKAFQQMLWQAGTAASARFEPVVLSVQNNAFVLQGQTSKEIIRREAIPPAVTTTFPTAQTLTFVPSGRIDAASFAAIRQPIEIKSSKINYKVDFTVIGESNVQVSQ